MQKSISIPAVSIIAVAAVTVLAPVLGEQALLLGLAAAVVLTIFAVLLLIDLRRAAFLALAVAAFTSSWTTVRALGQVGNVSDLFLLLAAVLVLVRRCAHWDWHWDFGALRRFALPVLLLVIAGIIATFQAVDPAGSLRVTADIGLTLLLVPLVIAETAGSIRALRALLQVFVLGAAVTSLTALSDMFLKTQFQLRATGAPPLWGRYAGLTAHPNDLGLVTALGIGAGLGLYFTGKHSRAYYLLAPIPIVLCAAGLVPSASLTAVMTDATAVLAVGLFLAVRQPKYFLAAPAAGALVLIAVLGVGLSGNGTLLFERLEAGPQNASSLAERLQTYSWAWSQIQVSPIIGRGLDQVGQGTTELRLAEIQETRIHDQWVEMWYTGGLLGLLALGLYYIQVWRLRSRITPLIAVPGTAMLMVWLVDTLSQPSIYSRFGMFGVLCLIAAYCVQTSPAAVPDERPSGPIPARIGPPMPLPETPTAPDSGFSAETVSPSGLDSSQRPVAAEPSSNALPVLPTSALLNTPDAVQVGPSRNTEAVVQTSEAKPQRMRDLIFGSPFGVLALVALACLLLDIAIVDQREAWPPRVRRDRATDLGTTERKGSV